MRPSATGAATATGIASTAPKLTTALSSDKNFAGTFSLDTTDVSTDPNLSKKNPQSSTVTPPVSKIPVTVEDGLVTFGGAGTDPCGTAALAHCIGDWARLNVDNGAAGPVKVTIMLYGKSVPNAATTSNIKLFHEGSSPNPITTQCGATTLPTSGGAECITVTKVGSNFKIVGWLNHNGYIRGGY